MRFLFKRVLTLLILTCSAQLSAQVQYIPNLGQWEGNFEYKVPVGESALFLSKNGYTAHLRVTHDHHKADYNHEETPGAAYRMRWLHAQDGQFSEGARFSTYHNYFLSNDSSRWRHHVPLFKALSQNLNESVEIRWQGDQNRFKYDIVLDSPSNLAKLGQVYEGVESLEVEEGRLQIKLSNGSLNEFIPEAYQLVNGQKKTIECNYKLSGDTVRYELDGLHGEFPVIIDPVLVFSTYSGSASANWGYTATYSSDGSFYAGGISLGAAFPADSLGIQAKFGGGPSDVTVHKFNADGTQMIFATFLGGKRAEQPHSMMEDEDGNLLLMGNTGSLDFPVTAGVMQNNFRPSKSAKGHVFSYPQGAHLFICKIAGNGSKLIKSTYLGGNGNEGLNLGIFDNYGDNNRGEIQALPGGKIAFITQSSSGDLNIDSSYAPQSTGTQRVLVAVMNRDFNSFSWAKLYGGDGEDAGYALRASDTRLYITGSTFSQNLPGTSNGLQSSNAGQGDGFVASFALNSGQLLNATYLGTSKLDQSFLIDIDKYGYPYVLGQTNGNMAVSPNVYANPNSQQFIKKLSADLKSIEWETLIGSGQSKRDLVPSALMVDRCTNIYLSGWNGASNDIDSRGQLGNTRGLPTTANALQRTTDGADFYFMVLQRNAKSLLYGTYFGASAEEHCDGGTSRFSPEGTIYQAACASCFNNDFPTTPGSYSPTKPNSSCNYAAIKIDFETLVESRPRIDFSADVDTVCNTLKVKFTNNSRRATSYFWDFGNGQTDTLFEPEATYSKFGTYRVMLVAEDTICEISDTSYIEIVHDKGLETKASFESEYIGCDANYEASFRNTTPNAMKVEWLFPDGAREIGPEVDHRFAGQGTYKVRMVATDSTCLTSDTVESTVTFLDSVPTPFVNAYSPECNEGKLVYEFRDQRKRYSYQWVVEGDTLYTARPGIQFEESGKYNLDLTVFDSICGSLYEQSFQIRIDDVIQDIYVPNAFTPNNDGINDFLLITGNNCANPNQMQIFNRWGTRVFVTDRPFEHFWDGKVNGREASQGVYVYLLKSENKVHKGHITLVR